MNKGPRYLNRGGELQADQSVLDSMQEMYVEFIETQSSALTELPSRFMEYFNSIRIISFRKSLPKSLNLKGEAVLKEARVWTLWLFVLFLNGQEDAKGIIKILREGLHIVRNPDELISGLSELLEKCSHIELDSEDEIEIEHLIGNKNTSQQQTSKEVQAISKCGKFALVLVSPEVQKKLKSNLAVVPVEKNEWIGDVDCLNRLSLNSMLEQSNYAYHPCPPLR